MTMIIVLVTASFMTAIISALVGMAGGIVLLSIMNFFLPLTTKVPIHGAVQLASNSTRTLALLPHVKKQIFFPALIGMPIGTAIATHVILTIDNHEIFYLLIAGLIFYVVFKPKKMPELRIPFWCFGLLALAVGFLNPLIGATGPIMAPFYLRQDLTKEEIVATKASVQAFGHLLKLPAFLYLGFAYEDHWLLISLMIAGVILGTSVGVKILKNLNEKWFRLIFKTALLAAALRLLYKFFSV